MYGGPHSIYERFARVAPASPVQLPLTLMANSPPPPPLPLPVPNPTQPNGSTADAVDKFPECTPGGAYRSSSNLNALETTITVLVNCVVFSTPRVLKTTKSSQRYE